MAPEPSSSRPPGETSDVSADPDSQSRRASRRDFLRGRLLARPAQETDSPAPESTSVKPKADDPDSYLLQIARQAMACEFQVFLNAGQADSDTERVLAALEMLDVLEQQLTVYRTDSEVSRLNQAAASQPFRVDAGLFRLLQTACELSRRTGGAFDVTTGPLTKVWGFFRRDGRVPTEEAIRTALQSVGTQHVRLDPERRTVAYDRAEVEVNLGAIGKGYALDRVAAELTASGTSDFLVHGGRSSVLARGNRLSAHVSGRGWLVALQHPLRSELRIAEIWLKDQALGTSGCGNQFFHHQGKRYGHILDPRTGWPAQGVLSATVLADTAREADALATALYVMGPEDATAFCQAHPEIPALLVCPDQREGSYRVLALNMSDVDWTTHVPTEYAE